MEDGVGSETSKLADWADVARVCAKLNARGARYVVVGGYAIIRLGHVRSTEDIDLLLHPSQVNQDAVIDALSTLHDGAANALRGEDLSSELVVRIADEVFVDLMFV